VLDVNTWGHLNDAGSGEVHIDLHINAGVPAVEIVR
jgi:hypothetical protein